MEIHQVYPPGYTSHVEYDEEDAIYVAWCPELDWQGIRRCRTHGATIHEALARLHDARGLLLTSMVEAGLPVPEPRSHLSITMR